MFASPFHPLHLPPLIKRLKVTTRSSGHSLDEPAQVPAPVSLEELAFIGSGDEGTVTLLGVRGWPRPLPQPLLEGDAGFGGAGGKRRNAAPALGMRTVQERLLPLAGMRGSIPQHPRLCGVARCHVAAGVRGCPRRGMRGFDAEDQPRLGGWAKTLSSPNLPPRFLAPSSKGSSSKAFQTVKSRGNTIVLLSRASTVIATCTTFWTRSKLRR